MLTVSLFARHATSLMHAGPLHAAGEGAISVGLLAHACGIALCAPQVVWTVVIEALPMVGKNAMQIRAMVLRQVRHDISSSRA